MRSLCSVLLCLFSTLSIAAHAAIPLGMKVEDRALVDVTADGFDALEGAVGEIVPAEIPVPVVSISDGWPQNCNSCLYAYSVYTDDLRAFVELDSVELQPVTDHLELTANGRARVNSAGVPGHLDYAGQLVYIPFSGTCDVWVREIDLDIQAGIDLDLVSDPKGVDVDGDGFPDTKRLDAEVTSITWSWDAKPEDIVLDGCQGIEDLISVLDFFGLDLRQIVLDQVSTQIDDLITTLPDQIEPLIEGAFDSLVISQPLDVLGHPLTVTAWPDTLAIQKDGLRAGLAMVVDTELHPCMAGYGITGSLQTPGAPPGLDHSGSALPMPHAVAVVDDDLVNHLLFGIWATGALCVDLADENGPVSLPFALDTNLLAILAGEEAFAHLFPEPAPLGMVTDPREPPVATVGGTHDVDITIDPVGIRITAEVDGREARLVNIDVSADMGADLAFQPSSGVLDILVHASAQDITPTVTYNELAPESSARIEGAFGTILNNLVEPLLENIGDQSLSLPSIEGLGVTDLLAAPAGTNQEHLGVYATVGPVPYQSQAGCDTSGCTGGCSTSSGPGGMLLLLFPLLGAALRRRG